MIPTRDEAEQELKLAGELNPGPWIDHSINTGLAAQKIAELCYDLDPDKAYVLGILHDIERRVGVVSIPIHIYEGYQYCMEKGWDEVGKICMTHSYSIKERDFASNVIDEELIIKDYVTKCIYDDYDRLIIMCDSLAVAHGFCILEKRFIDVARRYGVWDSSVSRWNETLKIKEYFENKTKCSIYDILPEVKDTTFIEAPVWKPFHT